METLKVSTKSNPNSVAGAMAGVVRADGEVVVQVVGAGALNQAVKAIAIARGYVAAGGIDLVCVPTFAEVEIDGEPRTAIRLEVHDRGRVPERLAPPPGPSDVPRSSPGAPGPTLAGPAAAPGAPRPVPAAKPGEGSATNVRPRIGDRRPAPTRAAPARPATDLPPRATA